MSNSSLESATFSCRGFTQELCKYSSARPPFLVLMRKPLLSPSHTTPTNQRVRIHWPHEPNSQLYRSTPVWLTAKPSRFTVQACSRESEAAKERNWGGPDGHQPWTSHFSICFALYVRFSTLCSCCTIILCKPKVAFSMPSVFVFPLPLTQWLLRHYKFNPS